MSKDHQLRIYNGIRRSKRRKSKGQKKKTRRIYRASSHDGWERKRAQKLSPSIFFENKIGDFNMTKYEEYEEYKDEEYENKNIITTLHLCLKQLEKYQELIDEYAKGYCKIESKVNSICKEELKIIINRLNNKGTPK